MAEHAVEDEDDDELSFHHQVPHIFRDLDWNDMAALMDRLDSGPISEPTRHLAQQQKQTILFKRRQLTNEKSTSFSVRHTDSNKSVDGNHRSFS